MSVSQPEPELFFSTVIVERVAFNDSEGNLNPIGDSNEMDGMNGMEETDPVLDRFLSTVDPDDVLGSGDPAIMIAVHATDPAVGSGSPDNRDRVDMIMFEFPNQTAPPP